MVGIEAGIGVWGRSRKGKNSAKQKPSGEKFAGLTHRQARVPPRLTALPLNTHEGSLAWWERRCGTSSAMATSPAEQDGKSSSICPRTSGKTILQEPTVAQTSARISYIPLRRVPPTEFCGRHTKPPPYSLHKRCKTWATSQNLRSPSHTWDK